MKNKKYYVSITQIESALDELEIFAKNKRAARIKAKKILDKEYDPNWCIEEIFEAKDEE